MPRPIHPLVLAIRAERERRGITRAQIARRVGVSTSAVTVFETRPCSPTVNTLERYANAVGLRLVLTDVIGEPR